MPGQRNFIPSRPSGSSRFIRFCQAVWDRVFGPAGNFISTTTVQVEQTERGIAFHAAPARGGFTGFSKRYRVVRTEANYIVCHDFNAPESEGSTEIEIAKPYSAQQPSTETIAGIVINYTYEDGPDDLNKYRTAVGIDPLNTNNIGERQIVIPYWQTTGTAAIVVAIPINFSGVNGSNGQDLKLIEVSSRCWAGPIPYA